MNPLTLRQYQWDAVRFTVDALREGASSAAIVAPTGSGKTTIVTSILHKMPDLHSAFVAAPQEAIERGFLSDDVYAAPARPVGGSSSNPVIGRGHRYVPFREDAKDRAGKVGKARDLLAGVTPGVDNWGLTTHSQMCAWGTSFLPDDLTGHLLVVDEAHHAGSSDDETRTVTRLGDVADTWRARGGMVLYVTATPYRSDGERVLPDGTSTWTWTIADHSASGYAPSDFAVRTVATGVTVSRETEYAGDELPASEGDAGTAYASMVERWVADGRPKAVFVVPSRNSTAWADRLERALVDAGARVCNAVGTDADTRDRFVAALDAERSATTYAGSNVDVFVACKRFDEGTDWPLCSHVYNWGVPSSFGLIVQRWGRTFRDKSRYPDYPDEARQSACMTFFVPRVAEDAEEQFKQRQTEKSWLLATYLADWDTGRRFRADMRLRFERAWSRRPDPRDDDVLSLFGDLLEPDDMDRVRVVQTATVPDHLRVEATALIGQVELTLGGTPTARQVLSHIEAVGGVDAEVVGAVVTVLAERLGDTDAGAGDALDAGIGRIVGGGLVDVVRRDVADLYRSVVAQYGDRTVPVADEAMAYATQFTGTDARDVAGRLRFAMSKPDLTVEMVKAAVVRFREGNGGRNPTDRSGDATPYFGFPETWVAVSNCLSYGNRGLPKYKSINQFLVAHGMIAAKVELTSDRLLDAATRFHSDYGRLPTQRDGDAAKYFGYSTTWRNIDDCLRDGHRGVHGGSSLFNFLKEHGLKAEKPNLTVDMIRDAIVRYREANGDRNPHHGSGDATPYFGFPANWANVNFSLQHGSRGLPGGSSLKEIKTEMGFSRVRSYTHESILDAVIRYRAENGRNPRCHDEGAELYFGFPTTWLSVNASLERGYHGLPGASSLSNFLVEHGFAERKPDLTVEMVMEAVTRFREANEGQNPKVTSGDATPYFGFPETWSNVSAAFRTGFRGLPGGSSLSKLCAGIPR